ncbi:hypothetical protein JCM33374_g491 [Metschnikowia sp. JCM 33374]|nr:hypothetical protein JCM33374_g491 [Metschnikowia sp. JCM 33374]
MWKDQLPQDLKAQVDALVNEYPKSESVLSQLATYYTSLEQDKRRKTAPGKAKAGKAVQEEKLSNASTAKPEPSDSVAGGSSNGTVKSEVVSKHILNYTGPIDVNETIFELPGLSYISPVRRKLNLVFHLYIAENNTPLPVLSVVNPTTKIPEISVTNLSSAIKLCLIVPILGNSTVSTKKDTVMLALWLHDEAAVTTGKNDPFICTLNLDVVKKQLMAAGKIPEHAEAQISASGSDSDAIKPINELIIDFLQRQFNLCGVKLINFLPSTNPGKNSLNMNDDNVICLSQNADTKNDLVVKKCLQRFEGRCTFTCVHVP